MGAIIPQVVTASRATGAQIIGGSLKFDGSKSNRLTRTFGSAGNRTSWTWSCWTKRDLLTLSNRQVIFGGYSASNNTDWLEIGWDDSNDHVYWTSNGVTSDGTAQRRDPASWYHFFSTYDGSNLRIYVNNRLDLDYSVTGNMGINVAGAHYIGQSPKNAEDRHLDGRLTQCYFIDGQVLNPSDFAFTDPLTNTWKPKKYTGTFTGTNTFYLPFDGNSPIGQDQSGNGNDFTPLNFGGSVAFDNPQVSGARPILNTTQGGTQAGVGVFGSKQNVGYAVTVYNDGGGNKYYIDGVKQDTVTGLIRGATYTFDTSDSTVSSHPFRFSATSNGSHGGGSEYTNGVAAITGAATTITVPHDAPNTLYYYCTSHSGMGADITGITTNEKLADQYASHCVLAVPFINGDATDVSPSIACTSTKKSLTKQGDPTSSTSSNFYTSSIDFDASGDYYKSASQSEFAFGTGDFTVEFWVDSDLLDSSNAQRGYLQISSSSSGLQENYTAGFAIYEGANAGTVNVAGITGVSVPSTGRLITGGVWNHIALVREGTDARFYINGFLANSGTDSKDVTGTYLAIGGYYSTSYLMNGRLQDFRIYKGVAKYNGSFEVPVTSPYILPDTPSGVAGGSKLTKITEGAVSFDGTGDYLSISQSDDFNLLDDGTFTIEFFIYVKAFTGADPSYADYFGVFDGGSTGLLIYQIGSNLDVYINGAQRCTTTHPGINKWHHIAVTRDGTTLRLFVDGILKSTSTASLGSDYSGALHIGGDPSRNDLNGFISNVRVIKGTALYTSRFTPPTAPLTNVTNTKLLCCQSNTSASDAEVTPSNQITVNNNSGTAGAYAPTGLTGGIDFPGEQGNTNHSNGMYLSTPDTSFSGNYTIEFWFNVDALKDNGGSEYGSVFWDGRPTDTNADNVFGSIYGFNTTGTTSDFTLRYHADSVDKITGSTNLSVGTWYHAALVRNNGVVNLYVNGTSEGSYSHSTAMISNTNRPYVGGWGFGSGSVPGHNKYAVNGKMSNLRMTSTAVYTANFTPPTSNLTAISGTTFLGLQSTSSATAYTSASRLLNVNGDAAATNFTPFNTDINTVRGQESGYCTLNPLHQKNATITENNLQAQVDSSGTNYVVGTIPVTSGRWYWEFTTVGSNNMMLGAAQVDASSYDISTGQVFYYYANGGKKYPGNSSYGSTLSVGDTLGVALDMDAGTLTYYKNGVSLGVAFNSGLSGKTIVPSIGTGGSSGNITRCNFGQKPFKFPPPDGFQPLNTANVRPETVISRPDQYVGIATWTGDGTNNRVIQAPIDADFAWIKFRGQAYSHSLYDTVRGNNTRLVSNSLGAEGTVSFSFLDDKRIQISGASDTSQNDNNEPLVGWFWKAGGNKSTFNVDNVGYSTFTTAPGLNSGTIALTGASVGTKQGFSIIKYTGSGSNGTLAHGLSQAPDFFFGRDLDDTSDSRDWIIYHKSIGNTGRLKFTTGGTSTSNTFFQNTSPTNSLITVGTSNDINSTNDYILYCWHDVPGLQKFGSFTTINSSKEYVHLGFKPAILWIKRTGSGSSTNLTTYGSWYVNNSEMSPVNPASYEEVLWLNRNYAEGKRGNGGGAGTYLNVDFLSDGFRLRGSANAEIGQPSDVNIYCAWAEIPSVDLFGGGANAR